MFELGPKQKQWIAALRSGEYKQGRLQLCKADGSYCCLGVANAVLNLRESESCALGRTYHRLGLRDGGAGFSEEGIQLFREQYGSSKAWSLIELNDSEHWTFNQIADLLEQHPEWVFTRSV